MPIWAFQKRIIGNPTPEKAAFVSSFADCDELFVINQRFPRNPITPFETSRVATLHPGLYKRLREGARRVIGATAKPLYAIDGKAGGLDRRTIR